MAAVTDSKHALDFLGKLDPRRYKAMNDMMKNDALRSKPDAYPKTLPAAFRIASRWSGDETAL